MLKRLLPLILLALLAACARHQTPAIYQYGAFDSFAAGGYTGYLPLGSLETHGDFGLGTVHGLSGEMIILDGVAYLADITCTLSKPDPSTLSPFAEVAFFKPQSSAPLASLASLDALGQWLDARLPEGAFAAARITARFKALTIRSVPGYAEPYPPLGEALKSQRIRELTDATGTVVGMRGPAMKNGVWITGWHFHFVSEDRRIGGHVLKAAVDSGQAAWMATRRFTLEVTPARGNPPAQPQESGGFPSAY